jgi:hypothetical protein
MKGPMPEGLLGRSTVSWVRHCEKLFRMTQQLGRAEQAEEAQWRAGR